MLEKMNCEASHGVPPRRPKGYPWKPTEKYHGGHHVASDRHDAFVARYFEAGKKVSTGGSGTTSSPWAFPWVASGVTP